MRCLWAWAAAAVLYLSIACDIDICHAYAQPQVRTDIRTVATDVQFQRAVRDNVRHIVVIDHIDMVRSQREFEGAGDSLNSGVVAVKSATKSIVVRPQHTSVVSGENAGRSRSTDTISFTLALGELAVR